MKHLVFYVSLLLTLVFAASTHATGNGAPSGEHYNLNIICVPNGKKADMTNTQGHTIFVSCSGTSKINLIEGADFEVLDRNGPDGSASFQLPAADTGVITDQPSVKDECTLYNPDGTPDADAIVDPGTGDYYLCGTATSALSMASTRPNTRIGCSGEMISGRP